MNTQPSRIPLGASDAPTLTPQPETPSPPAPTPDLGQQTHTLFNDANVLIKREVETWQDRAGNYHSASMTHIVTGEQADRVKITVHDSRTLKATINGKTYPFPVPENTDLHMINIETQGGNDTVVIGPGVKTAVRIMTGDGKDRVKTGAGYARVNGGSGNDSIRLGSGGGIAQGGDGDDRMHAGAGNAVLSGGKGNDVLRAGNSANRRLVSLNGDQGNDQLHAGGGINVLNGGRGDDRLKGAANTTFYAGAGHDVIESMSKKDRIYAKASDEIHHTGLSKVTHMEVRDVGRKGLEIAGTPEFIDAVQDMLDQLRGSPVGQRVLEQMDDFVDAIRSPVTLRESADMSGSYYYFRNAYSDRPFTGQSSRFQDKPELGYIKNEVAGSVATHAEIELQTFFTSANSCRPRRCLHSSMSWPMPSMAPPAPTNPETNRLLAPMETPLSATVSRFSSITSSTKRSASPLRMGNCSITTTIRSPGQPPSTRCPSPKMRYARKWAFRCVIATWGMRRPAQFDENCQFSQVTTLIFRR